MSYDILEADGVTTTSIKSTTDSGDEVPHVNVDSGSVTVSGTTRTRDMDGGTSVLVSLSTATGITTDNAVITPSSGKKIRIHDCYFAAGAATGFTNTDTFNVTLFQGTPIGGGATSFVGFTAPVNENKIGTIPRPIVFPVNQAISLTVQHIRIVGGLPVPQGTTWTGGIRIFYDEVD